MTASIILYSLTTTQLMQSVTPIFGEPYSYEYDRNMDRIGDVAAKTEARRMMQQSDVVPEVPVMFDDESLENAGKKAASIQAPSPAVNSVVVVPSETTGEKVTAE